MVNRLPFKVGDRYGRLTILENLGKKTDAHNITVLCFCDCGGVKEVRIDHLKGGQVRSCGCLKGNCGSRLPLGKSAYNELLHKTKRSAEVRGYKFELTDDEFRYLVFQDCFYCGVAPKEGFTKGNTHHKGVIKTNGIDRVDNFLDYFFENCVPCCRYCNLAKHTRTMEEFELWADNLHKHRTEKSWRFSK